MPFLSGCIGYTPSYYDDNVEFIIHGVGGALTDNDDEIQVYIDDKEVEFEKRKTFGSDYVWNNSSNRRRSGQETLYCSPEEYKTLLQVKDKFFYEISFKVKRERHNKTIKITRNGQPNTIFDLHPQTTDEKWASGKAEWFSKKETTAGILLLPTNSYEVVSLFGDSMVEVSKGNIREGGDVAVVTLVGLPAAIVVDVYNIVIGLPSAAIVNPWTNYRIRQQSGQTCLWVRTR